MGGAEQRPGSDRSAEERPGQALALPEAVAPVVAAVPGLVRVAASAWWHTTEWSVRTSVRTTGRVLKAMGDPDEAVALTRDASQALGALSTFARSVSGGSSLGRALVSAGEAVGDAAGESLPAEATGLAHNLGGLVAGVTGAMPGIDVVRGEVQRDVPEPTLRDRGRALLERSRDVWDTASAHPAFDRILDDLAPDEARILLLLLEKGPQPSVDVRTGGPIGMVSSQLIAPGLTMIGGRAGCRYFDQVPAYLNNLFRLGLVWFSREPLRDPMEYQVVEAQPDVLAALHSVKFAKVVRRSIHLTPFGEDFCRTCLVDEVVAAASTYPEHAPPPESTDLAEPPGL